MNKKLITALLSALVIADLKAASVINIDFSPADNGNSTQVSWYFSGDIVYSASGQIAQVQGGTFDVPMPTPDTNIKGFGISSSGLFSSDFSAAVATASLTFTNSNAGNFYTGYWTNSTTLTPNGPVANQDHVFLTTSSAGLSALGLGHNLGSGLDTVSLAGLITYSTNTFSGFAITLNGLEPYTYTDVSTQQGINVRAGNGFFYTAGLDSLTLPIAFTSFNQGFYSSSDISGVDGFTANLTVQAVPEPATWVQLCLAAFAGLTFVCFRRIRKPASIAARS